MESGNDESGRGEHEEMAEKNREEKRGKRAPFNLGARKHWINDSREREISRRGDGYYTVDNELIKLTVEQTNR